MNIKMNTLYAALLSTAFVLGACNDKEVVKDAPTSAEVQHDFGFRSFDLDIDTANKRDAIEASFDMDASEIEAEYKNKLTDVKLSGDKAYRELQPIFTELALTKDMTREEIIEKVSQVFRVTDYTEFDLDVEFMDGSEQEILDVK